MMMTTKRVAGAVAAVKECMTVQLAASVTEVALSLLRKGMMTMSKYLDLIAYPIMLAAVYVLIGLANWNRNPEFWQYADRCIWVIWGLAWGYALQRRIKHGGIAW